MKALFKKMKTAHYIGLLLALNLASGCSDNAKPAPDDTTAPDDTAKSDDTTAKSDDTTAKSDGVSVSLVGEAITLNPNGGRALFANVLLNGDKVITTHQIALPDSLTEDKSLYSQTFDRTLNELSDRTIAIDVNDKSNFDWKGDLGDHKLLLAGNAIYMVGIRKGKEQAAVLKLGLDFSVQAGPTYVGSNNKLEESKVDMGFTSDGTNLYAQFFAQGTGGPSTWAAAVYRLTYDLKPVDSAIIKPESGSFVTGTAIIYVPKGQMGATQDKLQSFSTNLDYGNSARVGIHTFESDMNLKLIPGSTRTIVEAELDTYFPVGPSYSEKHQIWVVGYTMENYEGEHGFEGKSKELGPSFITIFDAQWNALQTVQVNNSDPAFRVMTQTVDDDIYVVYDEMDKDGKVTKSRARIERYRINAQ